MERLWRSVSRSNSGISAAGGVESSEGGGASAAEVAQYRAHGFTIVKGGAQPALIARVRRVLGAWEQRTIASWANDGLLPQRPKSGAWHDGGCCWDLPFERRLLACWEHAGRPAYSRSPRRDLVCPDMYEILTDPALVRIARQLTGAPNLEGHLRSHSIFNARPKLPDQPFTDTPWHMDSQYYPAAATPEAEVLSIWIPVQHVSAHNSCLECAPAVSGALPGWDDPVTKFRGISPANQAALRLRHTGVVCPLELGDVLCLNQMVPHRALPNCSDAVRWSLDVRYERRCADACEHAFTDKSGSPPLGFPLPRDGGAPIVGCHEWLSRWKDMPPGSY